MFTISRIVEFAPVTKLLSHHQLILKSYPLRKPLHKDQTQKTPSL